MTITVGSYLSTEYLIDSRALLQRTLRDDFRPLLLHVQHKGVQRFFDMRLRIFCRFFTFHLGSENVFYENCCGLDEIFQSSVLSNFNL